MVTLIKKHGLFRLNYKQGQALIVFFIVFSASAILSNEAGYSEDRENPEQTITAAKGLSSGYRLIGTVMGGKTAQPLAFIEGIGAMNQGRWCRLHDSLADGSQIAEIRLGQIVLEKDGRQKVLILEGPENQKAMASVSSSPAQDIINKCAALAEFGNPGNALKLIKVKPQVNTKGDFDFVVDGIKKGSIIELAGLRNGDSIRSVNGQQLSNPQKAIQVFRKVRNQSQIDVELSRGNQLLKLNYELKD